MLNFPKSYFFVDGKKNKRYRPNDATERKEEYDGYEKCHAWTITAFTDIYERFVRTEITHVNSENDRTTYVLSEVYRYPHRFLSNSQHGMADVGYTYDEELVVRFEKNASISLMYHSEYNRDMGKRRMNSEWVFSNLSNRHHIVLGRWPFVETLFELADMTCAELARWRFLHCSNALITIQKYRKMLEKYNADLFQDDALGSSTTQSSTGVTSSSL